MSNTSAKPPAGQPLGISGRLARAFLESQLTPLIALSLILLGVFAVLSVTAGALAFGPLLEES